VTNAEVTTLVTPELEEKPEKSKSQVRKIKYHKFEKRVAAAFSVLSKLFVINLIIVASIFIFKELSDTSYLFSGSTFQLLLKRPVFQE